MAVLFQNPLQLMSVQFGASVRVVTFKQTYKAMDPWKSSCAKNLSDFINYLMWCLTSHTEDRINIGIVSTALVSDPAGELLKIDLTVAVSVEFVEQGSQLVIGEDTSDSFESLLELLGTNGSEAFQIKVFKNALGSFAFVVCSVSSLSDLFKYDGFDLC